MLEVQQLSYAHPIRHGRIGPLVFEKLDLTIPRGEVTALMGPSGGGKSTLGRLLAQLTAPDSGAVRWDPSITATREVVYVDQDPSNYYFPWLRVGENVRQPMDEIGVERGAAERATRELLELVELSALADSEPIRLSGGEQQRLALARALAIRPKVAILDESFSALDPVTRCNVLTRLAARFDAEGATAVLVTHDIGDVAALASRCVILHGRPATVASEFVLPYSRVERQADRQKLEEVHSIVAKELSRAIT